LDDRPRGGPPGRSGKNLAAVLSTEPADSALAQLCRRAVARSERSRRLTLCRVVAPKESEAAASGAKLASASPVVSICVAASDNDGIPHRSLVWDDVRMVDRRGHLGPTKKRMRNDSSSARLAAGSSSATFRSSGRSGEVDDAHVADAEQRLDPVAGEPGADPRVLAYLHVRFLAFGGLKKRRDDSDVLVSARRYKPVSGM
jgi:hypothetical protein